MITKQKSFNKSLVDENTQVIFMDEAHVGLLDPDDWKILTQGGLTAHDRKYKKSNPAVIRCPMFITCQTELDFGEEHSAAMDARLRKFYFKSLNAPPTAGVQQALHDDAMDCIVWASRVAKTPENELPAPRPGSVARSNEFDEQEKDRIMSMNLDSESDRELYEEDQLSAEGDVFEEEEEGESSSCALSSQSGVQGWERSINKISELRDKEPCHSLKERQLGLIASGVKRATKEIENEALRARERILDETRERWISVGMIRQEDAHLLENVEGPYHPTIERSREEYFAKKKEEEQTIVEEKAASYYENEWVWEKEKELRQLQEREEAAKEEEVKRALQYMIGVTTEALKLHFKREELPGLSKLVIGERKKRAMDMKWLSSQQAQLVTSVWAPLPFPFDGYESEEEESMFITQSTQASSTTNPSQVSQRRNAKKRPSQRSTQVSKRGRITRFFTPIQE